MAESCTTFENANLEDLEREILAKIQKTAKPENLTQADQYIVLDLARVFSRLQILNKLINLSIEAGLSNHDNLKRFKELDGIADMLTKQIRRHCIYLQIHPVATQGRARDQVKANQLHQRYTRFTP